MTTANVKGIVVKAILGVTVAGAMLIAGTPKAQAQQFAVGVQFGAPYSAGYYGGGRDFDRDGYRDHERREAYEFERRQAFLRQQEFERREAFARQEAHERHEQWERGERGGYEYRGYR